MNRPGLTYDLKELIGKVMPAKGYIFGILFLFGLVCILIGPSHITLHDLKESWISTSLILLFLVYGLFSAIRMVLDRRIKLVINKNGIWHYKEGLIPWSNVYYYYFEIQRDDVSVSLFKLKLLEPEKELSIHISDINVSFDDIEAAIKKNAIGYNILCLGTEDK
jgi:hypothetical protein